MTVSRFLKDPSGTLDYSIDWTDWLGTDTISSSSWTVPSGLEVGTALAGTAVATVWLSGGTAGNSYYVTNTIVTAAGRSDQRSLIIKVDDL